MGRHTHSVSTSPQRAPHLANQADARPASRQSRALPRLARPFLPLLAPVAMLAVLLTGSLATAPVLAAPLSGQGPGVSVSPNTGPAGTHITISGTNFHSGDTVTAGYTNSGSCSSGVTPITGATGTVDSNGGVVINTTWPSVPNGTYTICVTDGSKSYPSNPFTSTSQNPPAITVSPNPVASSAQVTVKGSNFLLGNANTVEILYGAQGTNGCATSAGTANVNSDGTFTFTFNAPFESQNTNLVVTAVEPAQTCTSGPTLSAQAPLQVQAGSASGTPTPGGTTGTATPTPNGSTGNNTPTPAATSTPTGGTSTNGNGGGNPLGPIIDLFTKGPGILYCLIGLLALLLLLLLLLLFARRRRQNQPATIQEQDSTTVNSSGGAGQATVQRNIDAVDPRTGRRTRIAEEVTNFDEE